MFVFEGFYFQDCGSSRIWRSIVLCKYRKDCLGITAIPPKLSKMHNVHTRRSSSIKNGFLKPKNLHEFCGN